MSTKPNLPDGSNENVIDLVEYREIEQSIEKLEELARELPDREAPDDLWNQVRSALDDHIEARARRPQIPVLRLVALAAMMAIAVGLWSTYDSRHLRADDDTVLRGGTQGERLNEAQSHRLAELLENPLASVRVSGARRLGDALPEIAIPALRVALSDPAADVRAASARALGQHGEKAATALPELNALLEDSDPAVRAAAREAKAQVQSQTSD